MTITFITANGEQTFPASGGGDAPVPDDFSVGWVGTVSAGATVVFGAPSAVCTTPAASPAPCFAIGSRTVDFNPASASIVVRLSNFDNGGVAGAADYADIMLIKGGVFLGIRVFDNDTVFARSDAGTSAAVSVPGILSGSGWMRLDATNGGCATFAGVGVDDAYPAIWTPIGYARTAATITVALTTLRIGCERLVAGPNPFTVTFSDLSVLSADLW